MKVAIHQSQYLPWPPYFKKIASADLFVIMDTVQYQKNGLQNRNKIRNKDTDFWLTIPVTGELKDKIIDKRIANLAWPAKHWKSIKSAYQKSPYWDNYANELESLYNRRYDTLFEINQVFLDFFLKHLDIHTKVILLSDLQIESRKSDLVLGICKAVSAKRYVSGTGAKDYLDEDSFKKSNILIDYLPPQIPVYNQFHGKFIPGLSMMDMLFNVSIEEIKYYCHHR